MSRADRVAGRLEDVDALLVTEPANLRYVTGFTGSNGFAVVGPRRAPLRDRLPLRRAGQGRGAGLRPRAGAAGAARRALGPGRHHAARVRRRAPVRAGVQAARRAAPGRRRARPGGGRSSRPCAPSRSRGRCCASAPPPRWWTRSTAGCSSSGSSGAPSARSRWRSSTRCACAARRGPSFDSIVASAEHGALPHATPRDVAIAPRHAGHDRHRRRARRLLLGLHADLGDRRRCSDELAEIYALVLRAQVTALDAVRPGPSGRELDAVARDIIDAAGHGEHFGHGLGHGVGARHARGAAARAHRRGAPGAGQRRDRRAGRLRARASAACGSRTSSSSPRRGRDVLSRTTKELLTVA